ncbi:MAG: biotin/lipoyl-binding protein [Caldithrix sp.]|nr:biotin/lipoyl-binding protein [Caldithrix sp.]
MKFYAETGQSNYEFIMDSTKNIVKSGQKMFDCDMHDMGAGRISLIVNGQSYLLQLQKEDGLYKVLLNGRLFQVEVIDELDYRLKAIIGETESDKKEQTIKAPIPGLVVNVDVDENQLVEKDQKLMVLEAMKMENIIKAPCPCRVSRIHIKEKQSVHQNQELITLTQLDST